MAKDKRVKGCPNVTCIRNGKKYKYSATDRFCTICGEELIFVCPVCFRKLADLGRDHILCAACQAEKEDRKANSKKRAQYVGNKIGDLAKNAGDGISSGAKAVRGKISQTYEKVAQDILDQREKARTKREAKKAKSEVFQEKTQT